MVPKSQAIVGLEIGDLVVRAVKTDRNATGLESYAEEAVDATVDDSDSTEAYQRTIEAVLYQLELDEPETYRLGVAFSDVNAGVGNGPNMKSWLGQQVEKLDLSFVHVGEPEVSFAPDEVVNDVLALFRPSGVAVSRMELSPVAAARVLPPDTTATLTLGSGIGWQVDLRDGRVFSAYANENVPSKQVVKILMDGVEQAPVTTLHNLKIPPSLLAEHQIPVSVLCPAAGVAKGIAAREAENLLYGEKIEAVSEIQRRNARKSTTGKVTAVPESAAIASGATQTKTTMFQPMATGEHNLDIGPPSSPATQPNPVIDDLASPKPEEKPTQTKPAKTEEPVSASVAPPAQLRAAGDGPSIPESKSASSWTATQLLVLAAIIVLTIVLIALLVL